MREYWFVIYPHCFLWTKGEEGLVYNAQNGRKVIFSNKGTVAQIVEQLAAMENIYCIRVTETELEHKDLSNWIQEMVTKECGGLVLDDGVNKRPLSLPPVLKVQDGVEYYRWKHKQGIDGDIIENLHSLVFYMNSSKWGNDEYSKQILYPVKHSGMLDKAEIYRFVQNSRLSPFLSEIILVGNPFVVDHLYEMLERLQAVCSITVYCMQEDALASFSEVHKLAEKVKLNIIVTNLTTLDLLPQNVIFTFIVSSEQEYERALENEKRYGLESIIIMPLYNGNNLAFFERYIYMSKEDMQRIMLTKREVFIRQTLNIHDFGKLTVMPDGKIYSNLNFAPIGTINETPHSVIYHELTLGNSWLRIRSSKPCCYCIYQWLCPSPSNYEIAIGKSNLCHIKE